MCCSKSNTTDGGGDAFMEAFAGVPDLMERARGREQTIREEVNADMAEERQAQRAHRHQVGDAVGHDGNILFVQPRRAGLRPNYGDNSALSRDRYRRTLQSTPVLQRNSKPTKAGVCDIVGCQWSALVPDHPCYGVDCHKYCHNLCAQSNKLTSEVNELNMYCSKKCRLTSEK